eukprot:jgi/Mesen1/2568/ME000162S01695
MPSWPSPWIDTEEDFMSRTDVIEYSALQEIGQILIINQERQIWPIDSDPCLSSWAGITCSPDLQHIVGIQLKGLKLNGSLPLGSFAALPRLRTLDLSDNHIFGDVPSPLQLPAGLLYLDLSGNYLACQLRNLVPPLPQLQYLNLANNFLQGQLPASLGALVGLEILSIHSNPGVTGPLPAQLGHLSSLQALHLNGNNLTGPIPGALGQMKNLTELWLQYNRLSGPITASLGQLTKLVELQLQGNMLTGPLPGAVLSGLASLERLYVSSNAMSGPLPEEFSQLQAVVDIDLSFNDFNGSILQIGPVFFRHAQLRAATNNFDEACKLGEGGFGAVFRGTLADGRVVAVKQLRKGSKGARKTHGIDSIHNEVTIISNLRQSDCPMLVCDYMPRGSLDKWLRTTRECDGAEVAVLDWPLRFKIALGVGRGLAYLHEDSPHRIIHRDVKEDGSGGGSDMPARPAGSGGAAAAACTRSVAGNRTEFAINCGGAPHAAAGAAGSVNVNLPSASALALPPSYDGDDAISAAVGSYSSSGGGGGRGGAAWVLETTGLEGEIPANILLDEDWSPRLADFGLARLFGENETLVITSIMGTRGYVAPEYALQGQLSDKVDVYSFGVVLLELISGRKVVDLKLPQDQVLLVDATWSVLEAGLPGPGLAPFVDATLGGAYPADEVVRALCVGLWCTQPSPELRPAISQALLMLTDMVPIPPLPKRRPFHDGEFVSPFQADEWSNWASLTTMTLTTPRGGGVGGGGGLKGSAVDAVGGSIGLDKAGGAWPPLGRLAGTPVPPHAVTGPARRASLPLGLQPHASPPAAATVWAS